MRYEYQCPKCSKKIEVITNDYNNKEICKKCNTIMKKLISSFNVIYKGNGWTKQVRSN